MKLRNGCLLLILALAAAFSNAQTQTPSSATNRDAAPTVALARCAYAPNDTACAEDSSRQSAPNKNTVAQFPRRPPGPPKRRQPGGYMGPYPSNWMSEGNTRGAIIGSLIGGGLGVAIGIKVNTDNHAGAQIGAPLLIGGLGALVGCVAGSSWQGGHSWRPHHYHGWPADDDEDASRSDKQRPDKRVAETTGKNSSPGVGLRDSKTADGATDSPTRRGL